MFQNKDVRHLFVVEFILFVILMTVGIIWNMTIFNHYKKILIDENARIVSNIMATHPELEQEIIEALLEIGGDPVKGREILSHYGMGTASEMENISSVRQLKSELLWGNVLYLLAVMVISFGVYLYYRYQQYHSVKKINEYMYQILNGNYALDIREYEEGDLSNLKNEIYKVTTKLKSMSEISQQGKEFLEDILSDISHQMRTPLTSMYVINDLLLEEDMNPKMKREFVMKNRIQLERMEWLVTSLLKMSRLDSGSVVLKRESIVIHDLIHSALEPLIIPMELKNIQLNLEIPDDLCCFLDFKWTVEAFVNMIKNAYEHTPKDGTISIIASRNPIYTSIILTDTGEGINESDISHIFDRFYKGSSNKESIGIGLNMAEKIIQKQNGTIEVESKMGCGTTFHVKFFHHTV